jgi:hypothetical protein
MNKSWLFVCLLMPACASAPPAGSGASTAASAETKKPAEPTIAIARLDVNAAQPSSAASVPMIVRVKVENRTDEAVTVDRIDVSSVGMGPYTINSTSQDFHHEVKVGHVSVFPVWVQAIPSSQSATEAQRRGGEESVGGQEGSMMMRAAVYVTTPSRPQHRLNAIQKVDTSLSH